MLAKQLATPVLAAALLGFGGLQSSTVEQDSQNQGSTAAEVRQTILQSYKYTNENKVSRADEYSKDGALEFWSSGGLLHEIEPGSGRGERYDSIHMLAKHIHVVTLVEGKAAVAYFYSEGSMKPVGSPAVPHYLTRVSQVFVNEGGKWKVRSSHWSPVAGGSGTSQVTQQTKK